MGGVLCQLGGRGVLDGTLSRTLDPIYWPTKVRIVQFPDILVDFGSLEMEVLEGS